MSSDLCQKEKKAYEASFRELIGYYDAIIAVHLTFKPEFIEEFQRLEQKMYLAKKSWIECINKHYLDEEKPITSQLSADQT
jgi:hypothetical protein